MRGGEDGLGKPHQTGVDVWFVSVGLKGWTEWTQWTEWR